MSQRHSALVAEAKQHEFRRQRGRTKPRGECESIELGKSKQKKALVR